MKKILLYGLNLGASNQLSKEEKRSITGGQLSAFDCCCIFGLCSNYKRPCPQMDIEAAAEGLNPDSCYW